MTNDALLQIGSTANSLTTDTSQSIPLAVFYSKAYYFNDLTTSGCKTKSKSTIYTDGDWIQSDAEYQLHVGYYSNRFNLNLTTDNQKLNCKLKARHKIIKNRAFN